MDFINVLSVSASVVVSLGGAGAILMGLSSWLGKVWAARILEEDKNKYATALEALKSQYQLDVEKNKSVFLRYSETQFNLYNAVWSALCELDASADALWNKASKPAVKRFHSALKTASREVEKGALVIEDIHYNNLNELLSTFGKFRFGKAKLIELREENGDDIIPFGNDVSFSDLNEYEIRSVIEENGHVREQYKDLMGEIRNGFKKQLRGEHLAQPQP
ncbi:hypothetical protein [Vibrio vulnificus]|uniref:hypothetical protein n=1 Tax=Vibrio vulnificus TaxID=672 RepID=UPI000CD23FE0|nr:hypothetical protein [Vibrio vulnificus]EHD1699191.1 hypothetical protein [Vibrio vulnificus]EHU4978527.1 hypothetical protein [Vibrio vulnificus]MCU8448329.1 hypothetical protein [Vibrio vulnificus]POC36946.1 hypothetical protein CRN38_10020 [Vibrio vulnificus]POC58423.1 hypothetical protein CRN37_09680 [Vibrio vulnificus]